jgi:hypothetical protein
MLLTARVLAAAAAYASLAAAQQFSWGPCPGVYVAPKTRGPVKEVNLNAEPADFSSESAYETLLNSFVDSMTNPFSPQLDLGSKDSKFSRRQTADPGTEECLKLTAPRNYSDPNSATLTVFANRLKFSGSTKNLVVIPGMIFELIYSILGKKGPKKKNAPWLSSFHAFSINHSIRRIFRRSGPDIVL